MKITYDTDLRIAGIALVPWNRLGPERWLKNYAIASLYAWDTDGTDLPILHALDGQGELPELREQNTQQLLQTPAFQALLNNQLAGYDLLVYRPVFVPPELSQHKFLMVDKAFTQRYENKVVFRELFKDQISFPEFAIYDRGTLPATEESFSNVLAGRPTIVIQDEQLSGGKGTFLITTYQQYVAALDFLKRRSKRSRIVVSSLVPQARERSIQVCVTRHGVFAGPLQRQIVRHPLLANPDVPDGDKFCGAQILAEDQDSSVHQQATDIAERIGERLQAEGYKGIFGIDFLLDNDDRLYTLEVNPRITGVTPLLTSLYEAEEAIPFYLLHLLELGDYNYDIADKTVSYNRDGALLIVHSLEAVEITTQHIPASGTYKLMDGKLQRISSEVRLSHIKPGEFIIEPYVKPGMMVRPGGRLLSLQISGNAIDKKTDELYNSTVAIIEAVRQHVATN